LKIYVVVLWDMTQCSLVMSTNVSIELASIYNVHSHKTGHEDCGNMLTRNSANHWPYNVVSKYTVQCTC